MMRFSRNPRVGNVEARGMEVANWPNGRLLKTAVSTIDLDLNNRHGLRSRSADRGVNAGIVQPDRLDFQLLARRCTLAQIIEWLRDQERTDQDRDHGEG